MRTKIFPLEKIFGSRTRVKIITLFTTGINRPYYVREISRAVNERLNAVRRELEILQKIGMLSSFEEKRRKYYEVNQNFILFDELASIMRKTGPAIEDSLFKSIDRIGDIDFACATGMFMDRTDAPTDLLVVGTIDEPQLKLFAKRIEKQLNREITYTPLTLEEYRYRRNFNDIFLRQIFGGSYRVLINNLETSLHPDHPIEQPSASVIS